MKYLFCLLCVLLTMTVAKAAQGTAQDQSWENNDGWTPNKKKPQVQSRYEVSTLNRVLTKDQFRSLNTVSLHGEIITIDTHNPAACIRVRESLIKKANFDSNQLLNLCSRDGGRYVSVVRMAPATKFTFDGTPSVGDQFEKLNLMGIGMMGVLATLPTEVTKWDEGFIDTAVEKWKTNATSAPVVDKDDWAINYIGHPVSGAVYYVMARQSGLEAMPSFGFSVLMSTFFWEYGYEALAETPSIQDLILTPTLGALLGEQMYKANERIRENDSELFGSKRWGKVGLVITDPAGSLASGLSKLGNNRYIFNGKFTYGIIPMEAPGNRTFGIPAVFLHLNYGRRR